MDVRQIRAFLAAYEEKSLTAAAERINATQPGVSVQISALESELHVKLFERHARGLKPTFAGKRLYPMAVQILQNVNHAVGTIRTLSKAVTGAFSIGVPPTLSKAILAPVLSKFVETYPDVEVRVVEAYSITLLPLLESGELDCAVVTLLPARPELKFTPIYGDRFVLVSGAKLNLPRGHAISLNDSRCLKLVTPSLRLAPHHPLEPIIRTDRIKPERLIEIDGLSGTLKFLEATDWAGLLPFAAVHDELHNSGLRINPIAGPEIRIEYFVAQLGTKFLLPAVQSFLDLAAAALQRIAEKYEAQQERLAAFADARPREIGSTSSARPPHVSVRSKARSHR